MEEVVIASSSIDGGISCWDLQSGKECLRYKNCASPSHGLVSIGHSFLASSQLRDSPSSGFVHYWSWHKPQVEVRSFPTNQIKPLLSNRDGTYLFGGSVSGDIFCWEVSSGRLLKKWHAHYRSVTCLVLSDDESLLISGSEDGSVRVWSLFMIFDDIGREQAGHLYLHSFSEHALCVTDLVVGYGGSNAVIVSASEDRTCKVWSLLTGRLLRNIVFPSIIVAIALDPGEDVFYAGGRDGKIYVVALNAESPSNSTFGLHIIGSLPEQSKAVTCLALCSDGVSLVSGSEDGLIRIWNTRSRTVVRIFKHAKGPVNNILVLTFPEGFLTSRASLSRRQSSSLPRPLEKYANSTDENTGTKTFIGSQATGCTFFDVSYIIDHVMNDQVNEIKQQGSFAAAMMEIERQKADCKRALHMAQQWKKNFDSLHSFCVDEILEGDQSKKQNSTSS